MSNTPIADHAMLSDCHSSALVDRGGSVTWWCAPRFDSPPVFARLLDDAAGYFSLWPDAVTSVARSYLDGTLVLVTTFRTETGTVELTDALAMAGGVRNHDVGRESPHVLLRRLECVEGRVEVAVEFVPRFEYGLTKPVVRTVDGGVVARGGAVTLVLSTSTALTVDGPAASGRLTLSAGQTTGFAVQYADSWTPAPRPWTDDQISLRVADTAEAWRSWTKTHQRYEGPHAALVEHSARVLHGLTYTPTGGIVAAPTTSLPEAVGGERNWDYRFVWVRDASLTLDALWVAACPDEAGAFLRFLTTVSSTFHETRRLQIMFGVGGERDLTERELTWLEGWRHSRPVRVGNAAWAQPQLDVYGELLSAVHLLQPVLGTFDELERRFLIGLADAAAASWEHPDHGIWEMRGEPRHFLHSKLMCWVALDRALDLVPSLGAEHRVETWTRERDRIRSAILERGWSDEVGAFTQTFEGGELDASSLLIGRVGFLPGDDPRVLATIEASQARLTDSQGLVYRYRADDDLAGEEGTFLLCTFWLAEALARAGEAARAREVFTRACAYTNDVGLLAEEVDPDSGELLGNFPQAFSHIGLINAAWAIGQAEQHGAPGSSAPRGG